jgi:hypothetical protein
MSQAILVNQKMEYSKSTKGTHVYSAPNSPVPTVYIKKSIFEGEAPLTITLVANAGSE